MLSPGTSLLLTLAAVAAVPGELPELVVLRVHIDPDLAESIEHRLDDALLEAARSVSSSTVVGIDAVQAKLTAEQMKLATSCDEMTCLAGLAGALGCDQLLLLQVARLGGQWAWTGNVVSRHGPPVAAPQNGFVTGDGESLVLALPEIVAQLLASAPGSASTAEVEAAVSPEAEPESSESARVGPDPMARSGRISVTSTPIGAECWVDNEPHGTTPCEIGPLPAGRHYVELRLADHHPKRMPVDVEPDRTIPVTVTLQSTRLVALKFRPDPAEAKIYIDGRAVGSGHQVIAVNPGRHEVRLKLTGYEELRQIFEARVGPMTSIDLEMQPTASMAEELSARRRLIGGIVFTAVAVAAAGFTAWQGIEARDAHTRMQSLPPGSSDIETAQSYGNTSAAVADGFVVASGASLAIAATFFLSLAF